MRVAGVGGRWTGRTLAYVLYETDAELLTLIHVLIRVPYEQACTGAYKSVFKPTVLVHINDATTAKDARNNATTATVRLRTPETFPPRF